MIEPKFKVGDKVKYIGSSQHKVLVAVITKVEFKDHYQDYGYHVPEICGWAGGFDLDYNFELVEAAIPRLNHYAELFM